MFRYVILKAAMVKISELSLLPIIRNPTNYIKLILQSLKTSPDTQYKITISITITENFSEHCTSFHGNKNIHLERKVL